jgi:hypothetical protein
VQEPLGGKLGEMSAAEGADWHDPPERRLGPGVLLATYLNDHLAGSTAGRELARRAAANNRGSPLGGFLQELAREVDEDRDTLLSLMRRLEVRVDPLKVLGGWTLEKVARLKPNGKLLGYSPLSRLLELEGLTLGVRGKLALWQALSEIAPEQPPILAVDLATLQARAERQLSQLQRSCREAAAEALRA